MRTKLLISFGLVFASTAVFGQTNTISSTGNVGIGTLNPNAALDVNGRMIVDSSLVVKDSIVVEKDIHTKDRMIVDGETLLKNNTVVREDMEIYGNTIMYGDARVGGAANISGNTRIEGLLQLPSLQEASSNTLLNGNSQVMIVKSDGSVLKSGIMEFADIVYEPILCPPGPIANPMWANGENKIYVNCPQVNVGINTTTPRVNLDVEGTTYSHRMALGADPNSFSAERLKIKGYSSMSSTNLILISNADEDLFTLSNQGKLDLNGRVEIKSLSNSPFIVRNGAEKILQLNSDGLLRSRRVKIDQDTWADYVFEEDYELMDLNELEAFIQSNKHLPEIPSTAEVQENGVDLAQMNELLLKKIEELVLYTLQQESEIEALEQKVDNNDSSRKIDEALELLKQQQLVIDQLQQKIEELED